mmetsp:Transcript_53825/g.85660  ORF Transcript_53825/g.85660 Transcript_53825/m.85660 type:complete len:271 (-) Transcript_53825:326-1138(-)
MLSFICGTSTRMQKLVPSVLYIYGNTEENGATRTSLHELVKSIHHLGTPQVQTRKSSGCKLSRTTIGITKTKSKMRIYFGPLSTPIWMCFLMAAIHEDRSNSEPVVSNRNSRPLSAPVKSPMDHVPPPGLKTNFTSSSHGATSQPSFIAKSTVPLTGFPSPGSCHERIPSRSITYLLWNFLSVILPGGARFHRSPQNALELLPAATAASATATGSNLSNPATSWHCTMHRSASISSNVSKADATLEPTVTCGSDDHSLIASSVIPAFKIN